VVVRAAALPAVLGSTDPIALTRPTWSALVTRAAPGTPQAPRPRRNASQPAPSSLEVTLTAEDLPEVRRHAAPQQASYIGTGYPIHHFHGR
jgi:hypothetical protein